MIASIAMLLALVALAVPSLGDEGHNHDELNQQQLGTVHFPTSCAPQVQAAIERGVALLHSFAFETAEATFRQVAADDSHCAMAHWGIARSFWRWSAPDATTRERGWDEVSIAKSLHVGTKREKEYVATAAALYRRPKRDDKKRWDKYVEQMQRLHRDYPNDPG